MKYCYTWSPSYCNPYISSGVSLTADQEKLLHLLKKIFKKSVTLAWKRWFGHNALVPTSVDDFGYQKSFVVTSFIIVRESLISQILGFFFFFFFFSVHWNILIIVIEYSPTSRIVPNYQFLESRVYPQRTHAPNHKMWIAKTRWIGTT